jgi:hypothetical protein
MTFRCEGRDARGVAAFVICATSRPPIRIRAERSGKHPNFHELGVLLASTGECTAEHIAAARMVLLATKSCAISNYFARHQRLPSTGRLQSQAPARDGFAGELRGNLWITLLRPQIVASDQPTAHVAEGDHPVSVLGR